MIFLTVDCWPLFRPLRPPLEVAILDEGPDKRGGDLRSIPVSDFLLINFLLWLLDGADEG